MTRADDEDRAADDAVFDLKKIAIGFEQIPSVTFRRLVARVTLFDRRAASTRDEPRHRSAMPAGRDGS